MIALRALPWRLILPSIAGLVIVIAVVLHFRSDARVRAALDALQTEAEGVVLATQAASGNDDVTWQTVPGQIVALGDSNRALKASITAQNQAIDDMAREAVRLRARAAELQKIADKAKAQRASALKRLSDMAITPGTRNDCLALLREAEEALDLVKEAGL